MDTNVPEIKRITPEDIVPVVPEAGGTAIVLQCNVQDYRGPIGGPVPVGALLPEAMVQAEQIAYQFVGGVMSQLSEEERRKVHFRVMASDSRLLTETGMTSVFKRAVCTGQRVLNVLRKTVLDYQLDMRQIAAANLMEAGPDQLKSLRDVNFLSQSPDFVAFLKEKYPDPKGFWVAYEEDAEKETRLQMGAEGPEEIAGRVERGVQGILERAALHHRVFPGRRLIYWVVGHYDCLSPFIKKAILRQDVALTYLGMKKGGGIVLEVDPGDNIETTIQGQTFHPAL